MNAGIECSMEGIGDDLIASPIRLHVTHLSLPLLDTSLPAFVRDERPRRMG